MDVKAEETIDIPFRFAYPTFQQLKKIRYRIVAYVELSSLGNTKVTVDLIPRL